MTLFEKTFEERLYKGIQENIDSIGSWQIGKQNNGEVLCTPKALLLKCNHFSNPFQTRRDDAASCQPFPFPVTEKVVNDVALSAPTQANHETIPDPPLLRFSSSNISLLLEIDDKTAKQPFLLSGSNATARSTGYSEDAPLVGQDSMFDKEVTPRAEKNQTLMDLLHSQRRIWMESLKTLSTEEQTKTSTSFSYSEEPPKPRNPPKSQIASNDETPSTLERNKQAVKANKASNKKQERNRKSKASASSKKKQKGRRLRPMSAYNCFFQHERARLLCVEKEEAVAEPTSQEERRRRRRSPHNRIGFADMGKMIAQSWKSLSPTERAPYQEMARLDKLKYEAEKARLDTQIPN